MKQVNAAEKVGDCSQVPKKKLNDVNFLTMTHLLSLLSLATHKKKILNPGFAFDWTLICSPSRSPIELIFFLFGLFFFFF